MKSGKKNLFSIAAATILALANSSNAAPDLTGYAWDQQVAPHMKKEWWSQTQVIHSADPDLVRHIQDQHVPPHLKKDWWQTHPAPSTGDALVCRHVGPAHGGHDVWFEIAPLK